MRITTDLPQEIHSITYVKNSHWIELEDHSGVRHKMHDNGCVRYECGNCTFACLTFQNHGSMLCPLCMKELQPKWSRMQVCFVPERETDFHMPQRDEAEEPEG